jgi:hypothetical protein
MDSEISIAKVRADSKKMESLPFPKSKKIKNFLKGPIPLPWLSRAAKLPGKTFQVAVALWYWRGIRNKDQIPFSASRLLKDWGVSPSTGSRSLKKIEKAKLILITSKPGKMGLVKFILGKGNQ